MTQSGQTSKKLASKPKVVVTTEDPVVKEETEAPKKEPTQLDLLIAQLKEEKPQTYDLYLSAVKARKSVSIYSDLSIRIG